MTRTASTFAPPVMEARRWLDGVTHPADRPLLNVSQAAPVYPPPLIMRQAIADIVVNDPDAHLYGPVLGLPALKSEVAQQWNAAYNGSIHADQVAITSGCNQAFAAAISTLCDEGSEVIVPVPYYFNHRMWLDMAGVKTVALDAGPAMIPDLDRAAALITPRTRAISLVSPNNPAGVEYPAATLQGFFDLCQKHKIALIVDETYRDFDSRTGAPHALFENPDWADTLIQLYSFSKAYRPPRGCNRRLDNPPRRSRKVPRHRDHLPQSNRTAGRAVGDAKHGRLAGRRAFGNPRQAGGDRRILSHTRRQRLDAQRLRRLFRLHPAPF